MKLFLDESVPSIIKELFIHSRVSTVDVVQLGLSGSSDEVVFERAQKQGKAFVTVDMRFVNRIFLSKEFHCGVVLLRYKGKVSKEILVVLKEFIARYKKKKLENTLVVVDREKFRVRKV